ncbi:MAG: peptide deformylase [Alphaproteobacteria bacterium]
MAILKIARMGHPVLTRRAEPVGSADDPELRRLVRDMTETLADAGGVGLAAPQVHVSRRVIVYHVPATRAGAEDEPGAAVPLSAVVDPVLQPVGDAMEVGWEGCLSMPGLRGAVPRHRTVRLTGRDPDGRPIALAASGFHARVLQHEVDHLDGILYPMRMNDLSRFAYYEEWQTYLAMAPLPEERG